jgi:hypothetical protein
MTSSPDDVTACRKLLLENGYITVAVTSPDQNDRQAGKKPVGKNWADNQDVQKCDIDAWALRYPNAKNTGILCGNVVAIDIDVADPALVERIKAAAFKMLGKHAPVRVGRDPRSIIVCRTDTPFKKKKSSEFILPSGEKAEVEILADGQQFVGYGIHPLTMRPYRWTDQSLEDVPFSDLPIVSEGQITQFLLDVDQILLDSGCFRSSTVKEFEAEGKRVAKYRDGPVDPDLLKEALIHIPNNDVGYDDWLRIGFACHSALGDAGFDLWDEWSQTSSKYDGAFTAKTWRYFKPGGGVTVGSLFYLAKQNGWRRSNESDDRPAILLEGGNLPEIIDKAEEALIGSDIEIYQRGGVLVRPIRLSETVGLEVQNGPVKFVQVTEDWMRENFMRVAGFQKVNGKTGELSLVDCPSAVAKTYLERVGNWRLPLVTAIIHAPALRLDGSIIDKPGYDQTSGIYAAFEPDEFLSIEGSPDRADAIEAVHILKSFIQTFPFVEAADRSVALAAILTGLARHLLPTAPMFGFSAPVAGSGKSLLVDLISVIINGRRAAVLAPGKTEEELEKRLGAALIKGETVVSLDNCNETLQGAFLCQILTQSRVQIRILGLSKNVEVPTNCLMLSNGNNLTFAEDMTRRVLLCTLNPKVERPEERQFKKDALDEASAHRAELVAAGLTILRAFILAGRPEKSKLLGSYGEWSKLIRSALVWLGEPDPCDTMEKVRDNDPVLAKNLALLHEIDSHFNKRKFLVADLISLANEREQMGNGSYKYRHHELHQCLSEFSGGKDALNSISIGKALGRLADRMFAKMTLVKTKGAGGKNLWQLLGGTAPDINDIL